MKIARVTGSITATVKDSQFAGLKFLVTDIEDGAGKVLDKSVVAADTCSAGPGDMVLLTTGSAARLPASVAGVPVDATIVALIDHIDIKGGAAASPSSNRRNK